MKLRSVIDLPIGMRYCFELLEFKSGFSRQYMLDTEMMTDSDEILSIHNELKEYYSLLIGKDINMNLLHSLGFKLQNLKDIRGTLDGLASGRILDEVELFEIKSLAILHEAVSELLAANPIKGVEFDSLNRVISILNPDKMISSSFYIYDSYSPELKEIRNKIKHLAPDDRAQREELILQSKDIEREVRKSLSVELRFFSTPLMNSLMQLARIDTMIARVLLMKDHLFILPEISHNGKNLLKGLYNPYVKDILSKKGRDFQPVDISFKGMTLIVGSNMGGKTVLLKSLALTQLLFQFGLPVPAQYIELDPKDEILLSVGDDQSEEQGISSFGAEMLKINKILEAVREGRRVLALIDEPARSTNPIEGTALVASLINILAPYGNVDTVMATHYNIERGDYRRLKVKGLTEQGMDYSIMESQDNSVPMEALNIASSLGIDNQWLREAEDILKRK